MPDFPWRDPQVQFFQALLVLESVHALPKPGALLRQQGSLFNEPLKRLAYQFFARMNIAKDLVTHHEEAAIDPDVGLGQRGDIGDCASLAQLDNIETRRGLDQKQGGDSVAVSEGF